MHRNGVNSSSKPIFTSNASHSALKTNFCFRNEWKYFSCSLVRISGSMECMVPSIDFGQIHNKQEIFSRARLSFCVDKLSIGNFDFFHALLCTTWNDINTKHCNLRKTVGDDG